MPVTRTHLALVDFGHAGAEVEVVEARNGEHCYFTAGIGQLHQVLCASSC